METLVAELIAKWGVFGAVFLAACYIIYDYLKSNKKNQLLSLVQISGIKANKNNIELLVTAVKTKLDSIIDSIELVKLNSELINDKFESEIDRLDLKIEQQYKLIADEIESRMENKKIEHRRFMAKQVNIGPQVHVIMGKYLSRIKCDHIVLGSFHNGNSSIAGIPYYKYDIVAERFKPEKVERDVEFAYMYKDVDILRHDKLPATLMQSGLVHYTINPDKSSELSEIDDIIYRRMLGRDIKLISLHILKLHDGNELHAEKPIGFVGCIKYDYEDMDEEEFDKCAHDLEDIYNKINK